MHNYVALQKNGVIENINKARIWCILRSNHPHAHIVHHRPTQKDVDRVFLERVSPRTVCHLHV